MMASPRWRLSGFWSKRAESVGRSRMLLEPARREARRALAPSRALWRARPVRPFHLYPEVAQGRSFDAGRPTARLRK
jgi:hypothetical protein